MRKFGQLILIAIIAIIVLPATITIILGNNQQLQENPLTRQTEQQIKQEEKAIQEQMIGMIAKEMPIGYEQEALKVQAIIARTHIILAQQDTNNKPLLSYMTKEEMQQLWGNDYHRNYIIMKQAVEDTTGRIITYENQPARVLYHFQSAGATQSAKDIWGVETPYLQSVQSPWDARAPELIKEKTYSIDDVISKLRQEYSSLILEPYELETQIQIVERTQVGYVKTIQVGNQLMSGDTFRRLLGLRSGNFTLQYGIGEVTFITKGVGHGVGLSQYGANEMAKEGKNCETILKYYFPDITIEIIKNEKRF